MSCHFLQNQSISSHSLVPPSLSLSLFTKGKSPESCISLKKKLFIFEDATRYSTHNNSNLPPSPCILVVCAVFVSYHISNRLRKDYVSQEERKMYKEKFAVCRLEWKEEESDSLLDPTKSQSLFT